MLLQHPPEWNVSRKKWPCLLLNGLCALFKPSIWFGDLLILVCISNWQHRIDWQSTVIDLVHSTWQQVCWTLLFSSSGEGGGELIDLTEDLNYIGFLKWGAVSFDVKDEDKINKCSDSLVGCKFKVVPISISRMKFRKMLLKMQFFCNFVSNALLCSDNAN